MTAAARRSRKMLALRVVATLGLLVYLGFTVQADALVEALSRVDPRGWVAAVALYASSQLVSAHRWGGLARAVGLQETERRLAGHYFAGAFVNLCLPSSLGGDALRAVRLAGSNASGSTVLAACTVLADRLAGLSALAVLGVVGLMAGAADWSGAALVTALAAALALHVLAVWPVVWIARWLGSAAYSLPRLPLVAGRLAALKQLAPYAHSPGVLARAAAWSWVVQLLNVATVVELGGALGLKLPLADYLMAVPSVAVLAILPLSISGVGAREVGFALLLPLSEEQAVSLGLLWFSVVLTTGLAGILPWSSTRAAPTRQAPAETSRKISSRMQTT